MEQDHLGQSSLIEETCPTAKPASTFLRSFLGFRYDEEEEEEKEDNMDASRLDGKGNGIRLDGAEALIMISARFVAHGYGRTAATQSFKCCISFGMGGHVRADSIG